MISPGQAAFTTYMLRGSAHSGQSYIWAALSPEVQSLWEEVAKAAIARHVQNQAEDTKEIPLDPKPR